MQPGNVDINDYFPGGAADIERINRDFQSGILNSSHSNQIMDNLVREIKALRKDLKNSNRWNIILGAITVISIIITVISIYISW